MASPIPLSAIEESPFFLSEQHSSHYCPFPPALSSGDVFAADGLSVRGKHRNVPGPSGDADTTLCRKASLPLTSVRPKKEHTMRRSNTLSGKSGSLSAFLKIHILSFIERTAKFESDSDLFVGC